MPLMISHSLGKHIEVENRSIRADRPARVEMGKADCIETAFPERMPAFSCVARFHAVRANSHKHMPYHIQPGAVSRGLMLGEVPGLSSIMGESCCGVRLPRLLVITAHSYSVLAVPKY